MSDRPSRPSSTHLELPQKGVELEDPGAQESGSEDEHFSDASEGRRNSQSRPVSPVPRTRVEKVDDEPRYGEVPGTPAYEKRGQDAVPDEIEVVPEGSRSRRLSTTEDPVTPGGTPIPRTVVEKVDPSTPSYGEVPGTEAYQLRQADAVPDIILNTAQAAEQSASLDPAAPVAPEHTVPETLLSRVDTLPNEDPSSPRPLAHRRSPSDALPDATETIKDTPEGDDDDFGSDFDDFEEGGQGTVDDDFGDFDEAFESPNDEVAGDPAMDTSSIASQQPPTPPSLPPLLDFNSMTSLSDLMTATNDSLDTLFPDTKDIASLPPVEPIPDSSAIFTSERSLSLWSQLVAPPPLQPPNWVKSRIRRLFLVSLGVPVDLDEILPASKQKKLILPSIDLDGSGTSASDLSRSLNKLKKDDKENASSTSVTSTGSGSRQKSSRRRGPPPPPELDLSAVRRLCATTDAALDGLTDSELKAHVKALEEATARASEVLEYWLKRRDGLVGEKEAFEGVIENLVNHARRVRK
ncbi:hypothetical protein VTN77DRAFT_639 [Rasamsonia byssochlamydoides]|uniref:uncharacterized protein n=1 Tax=Rasamsonia byssochlamydoides TaxID=89139 RepID=UPI0037439B7D